MKELYKINWKLIPTDKKAKLLAWLRKQPGFTAYYAKSNGINKGIYQIRVKLSSTSVDNIRVNTNALAISRV